MSNSQSSHCAKRDQKTQAATSSTSQAPCSHHTDIDDNSVDDPKSRTLDIMNEMPTDILLEIFSHVEPIDLFHISRTTKTLRDLVTSSNSMFVWKRVRQLSTYLHLSPVGMTFSFLWICFQVCENTNEATKKPPPCPEGVNPIYYFNLLFGRHCQVYPVQGALQATHWPCSRQVCGSVNGDIVHWTGRLRFCVECASGQSAMIPIVSAPVC